MTLEGSIQLDRQQHLLKWKTSPVIQSILGPIWIILYYAVSLARSCIFSSNVSAEDVSWTFFWIVFVSSSYTCSSISFCGTFFWLFLRSNQDWTFSVIGGIFAACDGGHSFSGRSVLLVLFLRRLRNNTDHNCTEKAPSRSRCFFRLKNRSCCCHHLLDRLWRSGLELFVWCHPLKVYGYCWKRWCWPMASDRPHLNYDDLCSFDQTDIRRRWSRGSVSTNNEENSTIIIFLIFSPYS